jgi:hypothetical protein
MEIPLARPELLLFCLVLQQHFPSFLALRQARDANPHRRSAGETLSRDQGNRSTSPQLLL